MVSVLETGNAQLSPALQLVSKTVGMPEDYESPELFLEQVRAHGLALLLYREVLRNGLDRDVPKAMIERLRADYMRSAFAHIIRSQELEAVLVALREAGITPILMKGAHLAAALYEKPELRAMSDVDLLLRPEDFERARGVFESLGCTLVGEELRHALEANRTAYHYMKGRRPNWVCFEVHNNPLHDYRTGNYSRFDVPGLFERASMVNVGRATALGMGPADLLLFLCNHYRFHGFEKLIWLYDIGLVWQKFGASLEPQALAGYARRLNLSTTLHYCLLFVRETMGTPVAPEVLERLRPPFVPRKLLARLLNTTGWAVLGAARYEPLRVAVLKNLMVQRDLELVRLAARLLFPTMPALADRYVGKNAWKLKILGLYYLVNPFHVFFAGLRAAFALARR